MRGGQHVLGAVVPQRAQRLFGHRSLPGEAVSSRTSVTQPAIFMILGGSGRPWLSQMLAAPNAQRAEIFAPERGPTNLPLSDPELACRKWYTVVGRWLRYFRGLLLSISSIPAIGAVRKSWISVRQPLALGTTARAP